MADRLPAVLVIGAGMYVGGRGTSTYGTVLPTLVQAQAQGQIGEILVAATTRASIETLRDRLSQLNSRLGTRAQVKGYPAGSEHDPLAYRQALNELPRPACAIVVVPDHLHAPITADVIRAGVHPMVVKPLTPTLKEARELITLAETHNVYGAVEFHKRYDESNLHLRQTLSDGRLGRVCYVTVEYSQRRMIWEVFGSWLRQTNIFQYLGVHYADLIHYVTGALPVRALATGQPHAPASDQGPDYDAIQALVEWEDPSTRARFVSTIVTGWIDPNSTSAFSDQKITVVGTEGRYHADQKHRGVQLVTQDQAGVDEINPYFSQIYMGAEGDLGVNGYGPRSIIQYLTDVQDLEAGRSRREDLIGKRPSFEHAMASTAVVEAVNQSLSQGGEWITIDGATMGVGAMATAPEESV